MMMFRKQAEQIVGELNYELIGLKKTNVIEKLQKGLETAYDAGYEQGKNWEAALEEE